MLTVLVSNQWWIHNDRNDKDGACWDWKDVDDNNVYNNHNSSRNGHENSDKGTQDIVGDVVPEKSQFFQLWCPGCI